MDPRTLPKKSIWKDQKSHVWSFYCPYCRAERRVPFNPRPGLKRHYLQVFLTAAVFTCVCWPFFQWKGIISFLPFWAIFETVYRGRVRMALGCPNCGFDPYLYLTDVKRARAEIERSWRKKFAEKGIPFPTDPIVVPKGAEEADQDKNGSLTETSPGS